MTVPQKKPPRATSPTGIPGLDEVLRGGLPSNRFYLLRGMPGAGKTTLALQFLRAGEARGEKGLYITLSETRDEVMAVAESHDWNLDQLAIFELSALEEQLAQESQNTIFHPSEVELNRTTEAILKEIERVKPARLVLDSLSELRLLSDTAFRYRRQMLSLKQYFAGKNITVLLLDDHAGDGGGDVHVQSIAHGVLLIEQLNSDYGAQRRRVKIEKLRGVDFAGGYHDAVITQGGVQVFPRLIAADHRKDFVNDQLKSGVEALDQLLGGGLDRGTSSLFLGPAGSGKSSIALQFAVAAAQRGELVAMYLFEETRRTLIQRGSGLGMPVEALINSGKIHLCQIDPAERSPGEFVHMVQEKVQRANARVVIIDSLNGYLQAMPDAKFLTIQLHELLSFLNQHGVITIMTVAQHGLLGAMASPVDLTYLSDTVVLHRYFEQAGGIQKALSVVKKRIGAHETTIRKFQLGSAGLVVGPPLKEFRGVLTGTPTLEGVAGKVLPAQ